VLESGASDEQLHDALAPLLIALPKAGIEPKELEHLPPAVGSANWPSAGGASIYPTASVWEKLARKMAERRLTSAGRLAKHPIGTCVQRASYAGAPLLPGRGPAREGRHFTYRIVSLESRRGTVPLGQGCLDS
jgi:hypothetical protein